MRLTDPVAISQRVVELLHDTAGFESVTLQLADGYEGTVCAMAGTTPQDGCIRLSIPLVADGAAAPEERTRLARDLHDAVTQSIYSLTLLAEAGQRMIHQGEWEQIADNQARMADIAQQVLQEIRLQVYQLRPFTVRPLGLVGALDQRLDAVEWRAGIEARLRVTGDGVLPGALEEELLLIAQEALNNSLKYARATAVTVAIQFRDAWVCMTVADNGRGFEPLTIGHQGGMGLIGMRERAAQLGGELSIVTAPGKGTAVSITAPYHNQRHAAQTVREEPARSWLIQIIKHRYVS